MTLDTSEIHRLAAKEFDKLYSGKADKWKAMVHTALEYAQTCVGNGEKVRPGDVVAIVQNAVRIDSTFEKHLNQKKLTQNYWLRWFSEYIVEQTFPQPTMK